LIKYKLTHLLFNRVHNVSSNVDTNFVGFPWAYGGWTEFQSYFNVQSERSCHWCAGDVSKKDQSASYSALVFYCSKILQFVPKDHPQRALIETLLIWVTNNTATHVVKWLEELFRGIIGMLFSGDFNTSDFNTKDMGDMWYHYVFSQYKDDQATLAIALKDPDLKFGCQGDDFIMKVPDEYWDKINLEGFSTFILEHHKNTVKEDSKRVSRQLWTEFDEDGEICGGSEIKFLQRYFKEGVGPFRPTAVYYRKITLFKPDMTPEKFCHKLIGLAYDTFGTNDTAYRFLATLYFRTVQECRLQARDLAAAFDLSKKDLNRSMKYKWGIDLDFRAFVAFPPKDHIYKMFFTHNQLGSKFCVRTPRSPDW